ncbi:PAS domain S-box protein [Halorubrum sp. RMP-47]|uniref:PAS domain S-box protein n=1 Tax=Halorubrum miltondacostae TaxID=3076378 RepID=UPI0035284D22
MSRTENNDEQLSIESGDPLDLTVEALPDAVVVADADTGQIVDANAATGELFHCHSNDLVGRHQSELHPEGRTAEYVEAFQRGINSKRVNRLQNGNPLYIETADGQYTPVEINARRHTVGGQTVVLGIFREVSEQLEREQQLQATTTRLETLLDALPLPVTVLSINGTVERWNQAAEETFGYAAEDAVGEQLSLFLDDVELEDLLDQIHDETVISGYETVLRGYDGRRTPVELYAHPLYEDDTVSGVIGVAVDISDQQRRVQQLEILYRLLRHNLRNQLGVIRGWAEELTTSESTGDDAVARISNASQDLLEMSEAAKRIQSDLTTDSQTNPVEIETVVSTLRELASGDSPPVEVRSSIPSETFTVPARATRAVTVLGETVLTHVDEARIDVRIDPQDQYVVIKLAGPTSLLPEGERALIEHGHETALNHGDGLDVAHSHLLVQSLGGDISLTDHNAPASTLRVELPRVDPDASSDPC